VVLSVPMEEDENLSLEVLGASSLALGTLTRDLRGDLTPSSQVLLGESLAVAGQTLCPTSGC